MLSAATFGMAQQAVTVKDSITHEAIPFVSVYFGNESGGYTDEQGSIVIPSLISATRQRASRQQQLPHKPSSSFRKASILAKLLLSQNLLNGSRSQRWD